MNEIEGVINELIDAWDRLELCGEVGPEAELMDYITADEDLATDGQMEERSSESE